MPFKLADVQYARLRTKQQGIVRDRVQPQGVRGDNPPLIPAGGCAPMPCVLDTQQRSYFLALMLMCSHICCCCCCCCCTSCSAAAAAAAAVAAAAAAVSALILVEQQVGYPLADREAAGSLRADQVSLLHDDLPSCRGRVFRVRHVEGRHEPQSARNCWRLTAPARSRQGAAQRDRAHL